MGGLLALVGAIVALWTDGLLRLLWERQGEAPYVEPPGWFATGVRLAGVALVLVGVAVVLFGLL